MQPGEAQSRPMKTLSIVCPVYNEEEVIETFYLELKSVLVTLTGYDSTILFVVDRCPDNTLDKLKRIALVDSSVRVLALSARFGHQMSLLAGIDHSDADAVIMMDSDLQHPPSVIPALLEKYADGYDVVFTYRLDAPATSAFKRISSKLFYRVINRMTEVQINESAADFRLISRPVARVFQQQIRERNQFLRGLFGWVGFNSTSITFTARERPAGKSKYSLLRMVRFGLDGVVSFSKAPLLLSILVGFAFAGLGLLLAIVTVFQYFLFGHLPPGWATLTVLLSVFFGIQLLFMGIMGAYVGAIFDEVKARPHYIVQERINLDQPLMDSES